MKYGGIRVWFNTLTFQTCFYLSGTFLSNVIDGDLPLKMEHLLSWVKMKSRQLEWLQDSKSALYGPACIWLYCQKSVRACITRVTCGHCVKLESPHIMSSFVLTCLLIISETINPNPAVPSVSESRTRLEGLKKHWDWPSTWFLSQN